MNSSHSMIHFYFHSYGEFTSEYPIATSYYPYFDLLFIHDGEVTIRFLDRHDERLRSGQGVLIYPYTPFEGTTLVTKTKHSVQHFDIHRETTYLPQVFSNLQDKREGYEVYKDGYSQRLYDHIDLAIRWSSMDRDPYVHELRCALMMLILGELKSQAFVTGRPNRYTATLQDLIRELQRGWALENPTIETMASKVGLSPSRFRVLFKETCGKSPGRFVLYLRIREAKRYLRESSMTIEEISNRLGYRHLPHFFRAFKSQVGMSPTQYRSSNIIRG